MFCHDNNYNKLKTELLKAQLCGLDHSLSQHDQNYAAAVATACVYSYITTLKFCSEKKKATM